MNVAKTEMAGARSADGAKARLAIALLTASQRLRLALLTVARILVGFCDLGSGCGNVCSLPASAGPCTGPSLLVDAE